MTANRWSLFGALGLLGCGRIEGTEYRSPDADLSRAAMADAATDDTAADTAGEASSNADSAALDSAAEARVVDASTTPSCQAGGDGLSNCGATSESCCTSLLVTGGTYFRTYDVVVDPHNLAFALAPDGGPTGEADPATVSSFRLDKYDVTVGRFRQFVVAWKSGWTPAAGSGKHTHLNAGQGFLDVSVTPDAGIVYETGWVQADDDKIAPTDANLACDPNFATWTSTAGNQETLPINCVNWDEAYAFCIFDGGFLPSEVEWEYAAAGGTEQRVYPWGATDPGTDNRYAIFDCQYPANGYLGCFEVANIAPVGTATLGIGRWGQLDLVGELFQWNLDWYTEDYVDLCTDCANLAVGFLNSRVYSGGDFDTCIGCSPGPPLPPFNLPRRPAGAEDRGYVSGIRCARSP